jgi:H(+)-translocating pyrophosphatase
MAYQNVPRSEKELNEFCDDHAIPEAFAHAGYVTAKGYQTKFERQLQNYSRMRPDERRKINLIFISSILGLLLFCYLISSEFATFFLCFSFLASVSALGFSLWLAAWVFEHDEGPPSMLAIADPIQEGSEGFFRVQYGTISRIAVLVAGLLFILYVFKDAGEMTVSHISPFAMGIITAVTFLMGAACSGFAGYSGMWVSVRANVRVAAASRECFNRSMQLCFRAGAFASLINVALAICGLSGSMIVLRIIYPSLTINQAPLLIVGFGFGSSLTAMFSQLGGGIYTKAADVGADLVGKVEHSIPEDDPRNPAVIADLVGDNVGDCSGQAADTFESIAAEIMSAMILGGALADKAFLDPTKSAGFVLFPLAVHCMDLLVSSIGTMLVRTAEGLPNRSSNPDFDNPLTVMIRAYKATILMAIVGFIILCRTMLSSQGKNPGWLWFAASGVLGMGVAYLFVIITQYYTDYEYPKVRQIAEASVTGPATNIITGLSVGMESTALPVIVIAVALISSYYMGIEGGRGLLNVESSSHASIAGMVGIAVCTMGMLSTACFVLAMSNFGPIADNAGGIAEMSHQAEEVRAITDRLDAVGNVTKANTKGFAVGSAALACFLLFSAFLDEVSMYTGKEFNKVDLAVPEVFVGGLCGAMLVFLFAALAMKAVGKTAQQVVTEVRRQFREKPGIMDFKEKPDYQTCVAIVSKAALREMVVPGLIAALSPIVVGVVFRVIGGLRGSPLLGAEAVAAFLMLATVTGVLVALFLNNAGGAWDNAKKYVETGKLGGKGSDAHKAAVVGDTVGDPCKDTAGPSVHVLIKLVSTVTMVMLPLFCARSIKK